VDISLLFLQTHFFNNASKRQGDERAGKAAGEPPILFRLAHFSFCLSFNNSTALRDQTAGPTGMQDPP
jgi:hypothetical protein